MTKQELDQLEGKRLVLIQWNNGHSSLIEKENCKHIDFYGSTMPETVLKMEAAIYAVKLKKKEHPDKQDYQKLVYRAMVKDDLLTKEQLASKTYLLNP